MSRSNHYPLHELLDYNRVGSIVWAMRFQDISISQCATDRKILKQMLQMRSKFVEEKKNTVNNINHYLKDGFVKVCTVAPGYLNNYWHYKDINYDFMYDNHKSWVYFIVDNETIVKVGESGNQLGIKMVRSDQPVNKSTNRFGRLAHEPKSTDGRIKVELHESVQKGQVSIWARRCEIQEYKIKIGGKTKVTKLTFHKELEVQYLDYMNENFYKPHLNACRK
jgi:hypothetical protein